VLWRERPDGELEVAAMRDGRVRRFLVRDDGSATPLESEQPVFGRWRRPLAFSGWGLGVASILAMGALGEDATAWGVAGFFIGMALFAAGGIAAANADDLEKQLEKRHGGKGEWHEPTNLNGWAPRTSEQLSAVEQIADEHDGLAFVRDASARTVDVCGPRKGRLDRYWVDERGHVELAEVKPANRRYYVGQALKKLFLLLWLGFPAIGFAGGDRKGMLLIALVGALGAVLLARWINDRPNTPRERLKQLGANGHPWLEIRTRVEEPSE
jgi:hypothetical protein